MNVAADFSALGAERGDNVSFSHAPKIEATFSKLLWRLRQDTLFPQLAVLGSRQYRPLIILAKFRCEWVFVKFHPRPSTTSSVTGATPEKPNRRAAVGVTSMTRPRTNGPRSLIRTTTERPLRRLVTRTIVPNGSVRCAAVMPLALAVSPLAVRPPE